jgi:hypothetical protein
MPRKLIACSTDLALRAAPKNGELASLSSAPDMPTSLPMMRAMLRGDGSSRPSSRCRSTSRLGRGGMRMERIRASSTAFSVGKAGAATVVIVFRGKGNRTLDYRRIRQTFARICGEFLCTEPYFVGYCCNPIWFCYVLSD